MTIARSDSSSASYSSRDSSASATRSRWARTAGSPSSPSCSSRSRAVIAASASALVSRRFVSRHDVVQRHGVSLTGRRQSTKHRAEERVAPRRLRERAAIRQERRDAGLSPGGVVAVDEVAERIEGEMLGDRHPEGEFPRVDRQPLAGLVECETERGAVGDVDREARRLASAVRASRPCRARRRRSSRSRGRVGRAAPAPPRRPPLRHRLSLSGGGWPLSKW